MRVLGKRRAEEGWCEGEAFLRFSGESATAADLRRDAYAASARALVDVFDASVRSSSVGPLDAAVAYVAGPSHGEELRGWDFRITSLLGCAAQVMEL